MPIKKKVGKRKKGNKPKTAAGGKPAARVVRVKAKDEAPAAKSPVVPPRSSSAVSPGREAHAGDLVIAGIGASAGGLEAFSQLLSALPPDPGLAIVLVQHLAPQFESALTVLLSARTPLPVEQA